MDSVFISREKFWNNRWLDDNYNHDCPISDYLLRYIKYINHLGGLVFSHGCGSGRVEEKIENHVILNDISKYAIGIKNKKDKQSVYVTNVTTKIDFTFDHLISHRVLHSCPQYKLIIKNLLGSLKNTGFISARSTKCPENNNDRNPIYVSYNNKFIRFFEEGELNCLISEQGFDIMDSGSFDELSGRVKKKNVYDYVYFKRKVDNE